MKRYLIAALLFTASTTALAAPISFSSVTYGVTASAQTSTAADGPYFDSGDAATLPLIAAATASGAGDFANASAVADNFFLFASSDASGNADASAAATFSGTFNALRGNMLFTLDFEDNPSVFGDALAGSLLRVTLEAGGTTLLDETFSATTRIARTFALAFDTSGLLDITLIGNASATSGAAFDVASAQFGLAQVPEPAVLLLLVAGLVALRLSRSS